MAKPEQRKQRGPGPSRALALRVADAGVRIVLAALLVLFGASTAVFSSLGSAASAGASESTEVTGISLKVYEMVGGGDETWVVPNNKKSTTTIATRGGQLRIAITVERVDKNISETDQLEWAGMSGFEKGFTYDVGDSDCISIDAAGVITAKRDGTTTVTVTPNDEEYADLSATVEIVTKNQSEGLMVTEVEIVDEDGEAYGDEKLRVTDSSSTVKLYVRVSYVDKSDSDVTVVYCNAPGAPDDEEPAEGAFDTLEWDVSDPSYASISASGGVGSFKGLADSTVIVSARITGGDESVDVGYGEGVVVGTLTAVVNIGIGVDGEDPADSLTVNVVYEEDEGNIAKTETYTPEEFEALGAVTRTYTLTRSGGKYVTDTAYGVPIATLLLEFGVDVDDVLYFTLEANDGANPGKISASWLLETTRYYLPNYDLGGSWQEKEQVPSMLALEDSWTENSVVTGEMNEGTRFRLMFGSATTADSATDKSIKFINTFTVVMDGAPPSEGEVTSLGETSSNSSDDGSAAGAVGSTSAVGSGDGAGSGDAGAGAGGAGGDGEGDESGDASVSSGRTSGGSSVSGEEGAGEASPLASAVPLDEQDSWRIYQMMNKSDSDLETLYEENPLAPYVIPALVVCLVAAAALRYLKFRYEIGGKPQLLS